MLRVLIFVCFLAVTYAIPFIDCGSEYRLTNVEVEKCKYLPCPLFMKSYTNISVSMSANFPSNRLYQNITIITKKIKTSTTTTPETCEGQRFCPVLEGDASFTAKLWVPDIAPFDSKVQWILTNDKGKTVMCFELNVLLCDHTIPVDNCYQ